MKTAQISRRKFMQLTSVSGACLVVGCVPNSVGESIANLSAINPVGLNQFISIDNLGKVILYNHRPEMGQGVYQAIPMILAEELEVEIKQVEIRQSEADSKLYGDQRVVGSRTIRSEFEKMRKMGAAAKEMLTSAAAQKWKVNVRECSAKNGIVTHSSGKTLSYGELVEAASKLSAPENPTLKDPKDFKIIGQSIKRQDAPLKTNGSAKFGIDMQTPGMLYASIERSPVWLGKAISYDKDAALAINGVKHVLTTSRQVYGRKIEGVAVIADNYWAAFKGRQALNVVWDNKGLDKISSETIMQDFRQESQKKGDVLHEKGDAEAVFNNSNDIIVSSYELPYQSHVPMEPMNVIASVKENSAEYWGSTQNPNGMRSYLSKKYNIPPENVKINYTFMGGGFGRRSMTDILEEAADLSKQTGAPIKVVWTREDDQTQGPFRNCSLNVCRAVLDKDGNISALEHKVIAQEIGKQSGNDTKAGRQLMGGITTGYSIPNVAIRGVLQKRHVPISYWRAVYHSTNPFAHESFIDELATKAGKDPLAFRLAMLQDHPRFKRVLEEIARLTNWYDSKKAGIGRGLAMVERSGAHFAMVVEVANENNRVKPLRVTTIIDVGICVNPDIVRAQTEGSVVMGLTAAYGGLTVKEGRIVEQNFNSYPLVKFSECPEIVTHVLPGTAEPDGAGEAGLPTLAPALANAIFDLTGKRIRKMPMDLGGLV